MEVIDGRPLASRNVMEETQPLEVMLGDQVFHIVFNIIQCSANPVVLGFPWFEFHSPNIDGNLQRIFSKWRKEKKFFIQLLILGVRAFTREFVIYAIPMDSSVEKGVQEIPTQYHDFKDVFKKKNADILPEYCPYDCAIELQDGAQPPFGLIYNLFLTELAALREYIYLKPFQEIYLTFKFTCWSTYFVCKEEE
jgi:hypothetical protein